MITNIKTNPNDWNKPIYIASFLNVVTDDDDNEIRTYDEPVLYNFNYQPVSSDAEIAEFGTKVSAMKRLVIPVEYANSFKEYDVAYLDGNTPEEEPKNGANANYKLLPPRVGNAVVIIYLEKLTGK